LAWTVLGVGAAGLTVGGAYALDARAKRDDSEPFCDARDVCTQEGVDLRDDAIASARISTVSVGVGLVGIAVGAVLLITHGSGRGSDRALAARRLSVSARGAGIRF
jgi:hypothetical protein